MRDDWMRLDNEADVYSPALLIDPDRAEENLRRMVTIAGSPDRLRPHVKTHKLPQLVERQVALGIAKCKCATIAEAEMAARAGARDLLLALQPVGPNVARVIDFLWTFPEVRFAAIADDAGAVAALAAAARPAGIEIELLLDLDVGQHRTGIAADERAVELYEKIAKTPGVRAGGLHAYDGHLHQTDPAARARASDEVFAQVEALRAGLERRGLLVPRIVMGGTPTFPIHARREGVECSPGTSVLWDAGYATKLPDLDFLHAAALLTRVVSKPTADRVCLDLGHKAVASEMPHPRVVFPALPEAVPVAHNEEHLVLETPRAAEFAVGDVLYGVPWHVCPTVALHAEARVIRNGRAVDFWPIEARARRLSI